MGQNFDDYSDLQKIPGMPILLQHSVRMAVKSQPMVFVAPFCLTWQVFDLFHHHKSRLFGATCELFYVLTIVNLGLECNYGNLFIVTQIFK